MAAAPGAGSARRLPGLRGGEQPLERSEVLLRGRLPLPVALCEHLMGARAGPAGGEHLLRQVRVQERELAPGVDELGLRAEGGLGRRGAHAAEALEELA